MVHATVRCIPFEDFASHLGSIFAELGPSEEPLVIERLGRRYRLVVEESADAWAGYDTDRVLNALRSAAGILKGIERSRLLQDLAEQREQASNGRPAETWPT